VKVIVKLGHYRFLARLSSILFILINSRLYKSWLTEGVYKQATDKYVNSSFDFWHCVIKVSFLSKRCSKHCTNITYWMCYKLPLFLCWHEENTRQERKCLMHRSWRTCVFVLCSLGFFMAVSFVVDTTTNSVSYRSKIVVKYSEYWIDTSILMPWIPCIFVQLYLHPTKCTTFTI
jgi:hypothetical protein